MNCFFKKVKPADAQIIKGFEDLRWDDQETIRKKVAGTSTNGTSEKYSFSLNKQKTKFIFHRS